MGKKKNAKKLKQQQQQQQATAPTTPATAGGQPPFIRSTAPSSTQAPFPPPQAPVAPASAPQQQQQNGQSRRSKKQQRAYERRVAKKQQLQQQAALDGHNDGGGYAPRNFAEGTEDVITTTDHFAAAANAGHGHLLLHGEEEDHVPPSQRRHGGDGNFVGQPLLDVLDGVHLQQSGSEAEAAHHARAGGPGGSNRRASLARRPAAAQQQQGGVALQDGNGGGPPPGAPTQPRAARMNAPPLGAPTGPKAMASASSWPQPQPHPPAAPRGGDASPSQPSQYWGQTGGSGAPGHAAASGADNPFGYNLQNATWDWNTFKGATDGAADYSVDQSNEADGGLNGSGSHAYASNDRIAAGTDSSAAWPGAFGDSTSAYLQQQQNFFPSQPFGQFPAWNPYLLQQQQPNIGYQPGYYNPAFQSSSGLRYIHGHTNSFTPFAPMASVQHSYQGHNWHVDKRYSAPNRGYASKAGNYGGGRAGPEDVSDNSDGGVKVGGSEPTRRSNRLAAKGAGEAAAMAFGHGMDDSLRQQMKSPSPNNGRRSRSGSPLKRRLGPLKPKPTEEYISQASLEPRRLIKKPHTLLVIIDLNGTLVHRPNRKRSSKIVCRPYVQAFLDYLLANHRVMVWSSARPENVSKMCAQLFAPTTRDCLAAEWGRDTLGLTAREYNEKVQVYKTLGKAWARADAERWHPRHNYSRTHETNRFGQHNTLLIDDSALKAATEPHNLVQVEEFEGKPAQMQTDVLRQVVAYLEEAKWWEDVSAWVRTGGNRFMAGDRRWRDYQWPEGTAPDAVPEGIVPEADLTGAGFDWWRSGGSKEEAQAPIGPGPGPGPGGAGANAGLV
ncbi:hypothetical protein SLS55_006733 [Diplodia seriata]|uniref:FCP1 homology domain-containing protein n=1 Tax=Diplodia seriata TaxID=420778 RepID=A0ABR3CF09_9PEZI